MVIEIHLGIESTAGGSWRVSCRAPHETPARARLEATRVRRLRAELDALAAGHADPRPALSTLFDASPALAGVFGAARGAARTHRASMLLVIESVVPGVRNLPWEGLGRPDPTGEAALDGLIVARLAPRERDRPRVGAGLSTRVRLLGDDPVAEQLRRLIDGSCVRQGLPPSTSLAVGVPPDHGLVLHLIVPQGQPTALLDVLGGADAVHVADHIARADLVVPWFPGAARPVGRPRITARLMDLGARACLIPHHPMPAGSVGPFLDGLYGALAGGRALADAIATARRTLPEVHRVVHGGILTAASVPALASPVLRGERWPDGWPMPGPEAARMIEAAYVRAEEAGSGFVGIEHLALALVEAPPRSGLVRLRYRFGARRRMLESRLGGWAPRQTEPLLIRPTPRLRRLGPKLSVGFSPEDLWLHLLADARATVQVLLDDPRRPMRTPTAMADPELTEADDTWREPDGLAEALEVLSGPEDGRRVALLPGEALGRASGSRRAEHRLYDDTTLTDAALSRRHIVWLGGGRIELAAAVVHPRREEGEVQLHLGELLGLTRCTWLQGIPASSDPADPPAPGVTDPEDDPRVPWDPPADG